MSAGLASGDGGMGKQAQGKDPSRGNHPNSLACFRDATMPAWNLVGAAEGAVSQCEQSWPEHALCGPAEALDGLHHGFMAPAGSQQPPPLAAATAAGCHRPLPTCLTPVPPTCPFCSPPGP